MKIMKLIKDKQTEKTIEELSFLPNNIADTITNIYPSETYIFIKDSLSDYAITLRRRIINLLIN